MNKKLLVLICLILGVFSTVSAQDAATIKVGVLHSLSGTMSISEVTVRDSTLMAISEINAAGGVLGMQLEPIVEDGASDWPTFAEKAEHRPTTQRSARVLLTRRYGSVAVV